MSCGCHMHNKITMFPINVLSSSSIRSENCEVFEALLLDFGAMAFGLLWALAHRKFYKRKKRKKYRASISIEAFPICGRGVEEPQHSAVSLLVRPWWIKNESKNGLTASEASRHDLTRVGWRNNLISIFSI